MRISCSFSNQRSTFWVRSALVALVLAAGSSWAGPEEDYSAGIAAYRRDDFVAAIALLRKAADVGHAQAQASLAAILEAADSDDEALKYYRMAAAAGNLDGMYGLAAKLGSGEGVKRDTKAARELFFRAAEAGHKNSIAVLAEAYIRGDLEFSSEERNGPAALKWITMAAQDNVLLAMEALEKAYREGGYGLAIDVAKADQLRKRINQVIGAKEKKGRRRGTGQ